MPAVRFVLLAVFLTVVAPALRAQAAPAPASTVDDEVKALRARVVELESRVQALERALAERTDVAVKRTATARVTVTTGADPQALEQIALAAQPTRDQARDYVRRIITLARKQRSAGSNDPQIAMLQAVGAEHLDVLVEALAEPQLGVASMYLRLALDPLVEDAHKPMILEALPVTPELINIVVAHRWTADAREIMLTELRNRPRGQMLEYVRALAGLQDPSTYPDLADYLAKGQNPLQTWQMIKDLPGIDLEEALDQAWRNALTNPGLAAQLAPATIAHGYPDALALAIASLDPNEDGHIQVQDARTLVLRHTEARGDNADLKRWFAEHKDHLRFDWNTRRFSAGK